MKQERPSAHFTWEEVTNSEWALRNDVRNDLPDNLIPAAIHTAEMMEAVRSILKCPIHVNSWYRNLTVNVGVGSKSRESQHLYAEAVDFVAPSFGSPLEICKLLSENIKILDFNQLIYEYSWVHIAKYSPDRGYVNRREIKTIQPNGVKFDGLPKY